jgi:hypothetical protein
MFLCEFFCVPAGIYSKGTYRGYCRDSQLRSAWIDWYTPAFVILFKAFRTITDPGMRDRSHLKLSKVAL